MRLSTGGWVDIKPPNSARGDGDAINIDAMELVLFWFDSDDCPLILRSADANASGLRVMYAPVASAAYSRLRDIAMRNNGVIMALNITNASHTMINTTCVLVLSLSSLDVCGLYIIVRIIMSAIKTVTPMPVMTNISRRMSRLPMCAISWAITPDSSVLSSLLIMPRVRATDASRGVRPVANAFRALSSIIYTRGVGRPAASATFSTLRKISRYSGSLDDISWACAAFSIIESPKAHDISIQIMHIVIVGIATAAVVCRAVV